MSRLIAKSGSIQYNRPEFFNDKLPYFFIENTMKYTCNKAFRFSSGLFTIAGILLMSLGFFVVTQAQEDDIVGVEFPKLTVVEEAPTDNVFQDLKKSDEKFAAIRVLKNLGVVNGYEDGSVRLDQDINRAEFTKILIEAKSEVDDRLEIRYDAGFTFPDIDENQWYAPYVSTAKRQGIIQGYPDGTFKPEKNINFAEAYKIILKSLDIDSNTTQSLPRNFAEQEEEWFAPYLSEVNEKNLSPELTDLEGVTELSENISRGAAFDALYRTFTVRKESDENNRRPDRFNPPDFFFGEQDGVIETPFKSPYYLPTAYRGFIKGPVKGQLYKMSLDTFLKTQKNKNTEDDIACCIIRKDLRYHISDELMDEMELVSNFETEIKSIPDEYPDAYYKKTYIAVPVETPGIYMLRVESDFIPQEDVILIPSSLSLLKRSGQQTELLWVVNSDTKQPISDASVGFYDLSDDVVKEIARSETNENGVLLQSNQDADLIIATKGDDFAMLRSNSYGGIPFPEPLPVEPLIDRAFDGAIEEFPEVEGDPIDAGIHNTLVAQDGIAADIFPIQPRSEGEHKVFGYTDRPIYRPGQNVFYKAIIRNDNDGSYSLPQANSATLQIINYLASGENIVHEQILNVSDFGTISGDFMLNDDAQTGNYQIKVTIGEDEYYNGSFEVESYYKGEYEFQISTPKEHYIQGDTITINVQGDYFFGRPFANESVQYTITRSGFYGDPEPYYKDSFGGARILPPDYYGRETVKSGSLELNGDGQGSIIFQTEQNQSQQDSYYIVEIVSTDESNRPVRAQKNVLVYATAFDLNIEGPTYGKKGEPVRVQLQTKTHSGLPFQNAELKIRVERQGNERRACGTTFEPWEYRHIQRYCYDYTSEVILEEIQRTDSVGRYNVVFNPKEGGTYNVEVIAVDSADRKLQRNHYINVIGPENANNYNFVDIAFDKDEYEPGETMKASITTGIDSGIALITFSKSDIFQSQVIPFNESVFDVSLPLTASSAPGLSVAVDILHKHNFLHSSKNIAVTPNNKKLDITVLPNLEKMSPGDISSWIILAKDQNGDPVQTELSLALVDKAIYQIRKHRLNEAYSNFYQPRYFYTNVQTTHKQNLLSSVTPTRSQFQLRDFDEAVEEEAGFIAPAEPAAALDGADTAEKSTVNTNSQSDDNVRELFVDSAAWIANITTGADGVGRAEMKLPDNLTTWKAVSLGLTKDTKIGIGEGQIIVQKDALIRPFLPRFVTSGDTVVIRANAHNYLEESGLFHLRAKQICTSKQDNTLCKEVILDEQINTEIAAQDGHTMRFEYQIPKYFKDGDIIEFEFHIEHKNVNGVEDTIRMTLPVHGRGVNKTVSESGEGGVIYNLQPVSSISNIQEIQVLLSPTLTHNLSKSLAYLTGFPYGCTEQTMSKFLPNVVAYTAKNQISFPDPTIFDELIENTNAGLQRLYQFQHYDGGWGWWKNDRSDDKNSTYVTYGLILAKKAGFNVDQKVLDQAISHLETRLSTTEDVKYHPYMLSVLTLNEPKEIYKQQGTHLMEKVAIDRFPSIDLARMIQWESNLGEKKLTPVFVAELAKRVEISGNTAFFEEDVVDYENMSSAELTTAVVASTFAQNNIETELTEKMIRWLDYNRQGYTYHHETHATAHAVIALVNWLQRNPENTAGDNNYKIMYNDKVLFEGKLESDITHNIDLVNISSEKNEITITQSGVGKMYYTILAREFITNEDFGSFDNGFAVSMRLTDEDNFPVTQVKPGDEVTVKISVEAKQDSNYVMIKSPLPAGLEPINPRLERTSDFDYFGGSFSFRDFYDDHIGIFVSRLSEGRHEYSYKARAVTPGNFHMNPTTVEMMYAPDVNGGSISKEITIVE